MGDATTDRIADAPVEHPVRSHAVLHTGRIFDLVSDTVDLGHAEVVREYVDHPGAVAIIALDEQDRVLLLQQYRHPVRRALWEPPAGLLDVEGEDPVAAAARELGEEADVRAASWWRLVDFFTTPGGSSERVVVYLARDLTPVPDAERYERTDEEVGMVPTWVPLDEAVQAVLTGRVHNPSAVCGILAAAAAKADGWRTLVEVSPA